MKIGIEMRGVTLGNAGGIAMLLRGLLRTLFERNPQHEFVCFDTVFNRGLIGRAPANVERNTLSLSSYFDEVGKLCADKKVDVLFRGYPLEQHVDFPLCRQVVEIPDIQHEHYPEFFESECLRSRRAAFSQVLGGAGAVGTISEFARQSLLEQPYTRCRDIFLMCPALQTEHRQDQSLTAAEQAQVPKGDYFLFPANLWKHKNHRGVLEAFERLLADTKHSVQFLFTGHPGGWEKYQTQFGHLPIRHLGFVSPVLLRKLLEGAHALVFFSLYEGFGMPLLEAFDAGTPVLCSNTTSLPEVGGDAVLSCDPTDIQAMSGLMARILREPELRRTLVRRGKERLQAYTWEEAADNLMAACLRVGQRAEESAKPSVPRVAVTQWPRVAIVTPSYNQGQFLRRTIDSVLGQNYPHIDYLVVDGCSKDDSVAILRSYGDRLNWVSERDRGQTQAINKGFARTTGEIRSFLNSDDTLLPGAVEKAVSHLLAHPDCGMVYGSAHCIDEKDQILCDYRTADYSFERLIENCCVCQPAAFWRSDLAQRVGPFDESLHFAMDYDYWLRIDRMGAKIEHLREFLACSRIHDATKTSTQQAKVFQEIIRVCMKNAGFASLVYYRDFWHYWCIEKSRWRKLWRRLPGMPRVLGRLHHRWDNRATYSNREFLRDVTKSLKAHLGSRLRPLLAIWNEAGTGLLTGQRVLGLLAQARAKKVVGFWSDNWVGETCVVRLRDSFIGEHIEFAGVPTEPMKLTVAIKDQPIAVFPLRGKQLEELEFEVEPGQRRELVLKFSRHMLDATGRKLSFKLHGTNLFSEHDLEC
jgi:glycosyltransferase involved in cell wall biosynthesis